MDEAVQPIALTELRIQQDTEYRNFLFVDQSLEELITQYDAEERLLSEPFKQLQQGQQEAACRSLGTVLVNPTAEIRHKLWAWKALRELGVVPSPEGRDEVQGVVLEIPSNTWVDTLAVYADGRVRYMNGKLGVKALIIWDDIENPQIQPLAMGVIQRAQALVGVTPVAGKHLAGVPMGEPRITVLTYGGLYIVDRNRNISQLTDPVLAIATDLFLTVMDRAQQSK